jgi:hypothetical protein
MQLTAEQSVLRSPVWRARIAKNGQNSRNSFGNAGGILCSPDCVAEGEGFELSVRFLLS